MNAIAQVRALFAEGATVTTVENTYRPELNGTTRRITKLGKSYAVCDVLTGPGAGKGGFWMHFPTRVRDVLAVDDEQATWLLGLPATPGSTVTIRKGGVRVEPIHATAEGEAALDGATLEQRSGYARTRRMSAAIRGVLRLSDGGLQVGYETYSGRDKEVVFDRTGLVVERRNTWS